MTGLVNLLQIDEVVDLEVDKVSFLGFGANEGRKNKRES